MTDTLRIDLEESDGRYQRQELISWWDQNRLAQARVLVVGAGALGNELIKNLALLGVGTILVVDLDRIENSNLSRCVMFREADEGEPKAEVVARAAADLNPQVRVIPYVGDVRAKLGLGVFAEVDVVLGGLDNREARLYVNQACWKTSTPWIDGAIEGLLGVMRVFVPPVSACYECTLNTQDFKLLAARKACSLLTREQMLTGKVPTTVTSASVIAAMQVQEAIKLLHADRLDYSFAGKGFVYNGFTHDSYTVTYPCREYCLSHDTYTLDAWSPVDPELTLGGLLTRATQDLGADAVIDLEDDVVLSLACPACKREEPINRILVSLTAREALCPECGVARLPRFAHTVSSRSSSLCGLTAKQLRLPPYEVVTGRLGEERRFYRLGQGAAIPHDSRAEIARAS